MYRWTPEMIRFLEDAAQKTEYYAKLAEHLAARLPHDASVCDVGCGLGHLAELLCAPFASVTAIDCSAPVLDAFQARLAEHAPKNLHIVCADALALPETMQFDHMIFCYFGSLPEILQIAKKHCRGSVVVIRRDYAQHRFDLDQHPRPRSGTADTLQVLRETGIVCECERLQLEFGQPLRSEEDAVRFFQLYLRAPDREIDFAAITPKLVKTGDPDFPFYYPQAKQVAVLRFSAAQITP